MEVFVLEKCFPFLIHCLYILQARIFQNFDDYPGFQKISGIPILLQHSVRGFLLPQLFFQSLKKKTAYAPCTYLFSNWCQNSKKERFGSTVNGHLHRFSMQLCLKKYFQISPHYTVHLWVTKWLVPLHLIEITFNKRHFVSPASLLTFLYPSPWLASIVWINVVLPSFLYFP